MASHKFSLGARPEFVALTLIRMFAKHKLGVTLISLLLCAISVAVVVMLPAIYRAEALVLVESQKVPERYVSSAVGSDLQDRLSTINQIILSSKNLNAIIAQYGLYKEEKKNLVQEEIVEKMQSDIQIKVERGWGSNRPGAFRVAYLGKSPTTVAEVANRLADLYVSQDLESRATQARDTQSFITSQLGQAKKKLDELEAAVSRYKLQHNGELPEQENALNATLSRLQVELQGIQEAINRAQQGKIMTENALSMAESTRAALNRADTEQMAGASMPGGNTAAGMAGDPPKRSPSEVLEEQLKVMRLRYSEDFPDVKRMEALLAKLKATEAEDSKMRAAAGAGAPQAARTAVPARPALSREAAHELAQASERVEQLRAQLKLVNHELETRSAAQQRVLDAIAVYENRLRQLPVRQQEMEALTRDYEISKANYKSLLEKKDSAAMAADMEVRNVAEKFQVLDPAKVPEKPYSPNRPALAAAGCVASLLFGLAFAVVREMKAGCLLGEWELPAHVSAIGRVPRIDFVTGGARPGRLRLALVSSAVISLAVVVAVGLYFAWNRM